MLGYIALVLLLSTIVAFVLSVLVCTVTFDGGTTKAYSKLNAAGICAVFVFICTLCSMIGLISGLINGRFIEQKQVEVVSEFTGDFVIVDKKKATNVWPRKSAKVLGGETDNYYRGIKNFYFVYLYQECNGCRLVSVEVDKRTYDLCQIDCEVPFSFAGREPELVWEINSDGMEIFNQFQQYRRVAP